MIKNVFCPLLVFTLLNCAAGGRLHVLGNFLFMHLQLILSGVLLLSAGYDSALNLADPEPEMVLDVGVDLTFVYRPDEFEFGMGGFVGGAIEDEISAPFSNPI
jgi:hypothetical protein